VGVPGVAERSSRCRRAVEAPVTRIVLQRSRPPRGHARRSPAPVIDWACHTLYGQCECKCCQTRSSNFCRMESHAISCTH